MDWKRFARKNLIPFHNSKDLITKIQDYGFIVGIKEKLREDFFEDNPLIGPFYDMGKADGKCEGKKEGYTQASSEFEKKIRKQAEAFLKQKENFDMTKENKNKLLDECEKYIDQLERQRDFLTNENIMLIRELKTMKSRLESTLQ